MKSTSYKQEQGQKKFKILDASAVLHSNLDFSEDNYLMPAAILAEIHNEISRIAVNSAIMAKTIKIKNPKESFVKKVIEKARETGDLENLSSADIEVIALAIETNSAIITDDYAVQNVAKEFGLDFETVVQEGIKKRILWKKVCEGCGREYVADSVGIRHVSEASPQPHPMNSKICKICGSMLRKVDKS